MKLDQFDHLCAAWGADLARWPTTQQHEAATLIAGSAEARALQAQAAVLDDLLDAYTTPAPDPATVQRLSAAMARDARTFTARAEPTVAGRLAGWWSAIAGVGLAGVAAGALAVTIAAGSATPLPADGPLSSTWPATAFSRQLSDDGLDE